MMNDPYSPCPCGSGKKFKWCCQPIHAQIAQVFAMDEEGQHEAALRAMEEVVTQHPTNAEAWGLKAQLLFQNEKPQEAEQTLEKAFELFPNYPFGYRLKARFRLYEGEIAGALLLLRKSAEYYDTNAGDILAQIYIEIFDCEMKLNHPIAARAAAELAARFNPANDQLRQGISHVFGDENPNLPKCASQPYTFKTLPASAGAERRAAWDTALKSSATGKLTDAVKAFEQLTQGDKVEAEAWYNLGLSQAWLGNNVAAVTALDQYVYAEPNESQAAQAWALAEVLRFGQGMEDQADTVEYSIAFGLRDPKAFVNALGELEQAGLLTGTRVNQEEGVLSSIVLEPPGPALTPELQAKQSLKPAAFVALMHNFVRLWNTKREPLEGVFERFKQKLGDLIVQATSVRGPAKFLEALSDAVSFPRGVTNQEEAVQRMREGFEKFYEETWIHRPLKSIGNVAPVDAVGHGALRKKLRGVVQFLGDCGHVAKYPYDFQRLSRKLGLSEGAPVAADGAKPDIAAMNAAELANLKTDTLSSAELDQAYQTAVKLDAKEIAGTFAAQLVERPAYPERPDRFPLFQLLINQATGQGNLDAALDQLNAGESDDCKNNEGRRRNEYEFRLAQLHAKRGEFDDAERVYDALIARVPTEINYRVNAAETMISARQKAKAAKYAKDGLAAALKANNRDLEGHFKELMAAAQK
ncbi:MAG: tetratricopeptide repeat protein [Planctomycetes bacterium]|nr:tetratricopeptide repeat protein [Planctomycetota bacterium]